MKKLFFNDEKVPAMKVCAIKIRRAEDLKKNEFLDTIDVLINYSIHSLLLRIIITMIF